MVTLGGGGGAVLPLQLNSQLNFTPMFRRKQANLDLQFGGKRVAIKCEHNH